MYRLFLYPAAICVLWLVPSTAAAGGGTDFYRMEQQGIFRGKINPTGVSAIDVLPASNRSDSNLAIMGSAFWSGVSDADVVGNLAYCSFANGLVILDVADPENPIHVSTTPLSGQGRNISVEGLYAYVASGVSGLHVLDISEPAAPQLVTTLPMEGDARRLRIQDSLVFIATVEKFYIVNIADPASPQILATVDAEYGVTGLDVNDTLLYVADFLFKVFDISDPTEPVQVNDGAPFFWAREVCIVDTIAYVSWWEWIDVLDVSDPTAPEFVTEWWDWPDIRSIISFDNYVIVANHNFGVFIHDVGDLPTVIFSGHVAVYDAQACYVFADTLLLVTSLFEGVQVADIHPIDGSDLDVIGVYEVHSAITRLDVVDCTAFVVSDAKLVCVDLTEPEDIALLAEYDSHGWIHDVVISGELAYVSDADSGLLVVDVSDPSAPVKIGQTFLTGWPQHIHKLDADKLYLKVNDGMDNLSIIDISEPLDPIELSRTLFNLGFEGLDVKGDLLYLAVISKGLCIVDVSDPAAPVTINEHLVAGHYGYEDVAVQGNLAYIAADSSLVVLDVTDPLNPLFVSEHLANDSVMAVKCVGNTAYCRTPRGIEMLDIEDPANPVPAGYLATPFRPSQMNVQGRMIYLADQFSLMVIADIRGIDCCNHDGIRGDADYSMALNVGDLSYLVDYLFGQPPGPAPACFEEGDADGSNAINVADVTSLVEYLFFDGPAPAPCP